MRIEPLHDRVLVKRFETESVTKGGIILAPSAQEAPTRGIVIAVGPGRLDETGKLQATVLKEGDKVLFGKYSGTEVDGEDGDKILIMRESDIMGRIIE